MFFWQNRVMFLLEKTNLFLTMLCDLFGVVKWPFNFKWLSDPRAWFLRTNDPPGKESISHRKGTWTSLTQKVPNGSGFVSFREGTSISPFPWKPKPKGFQLQPWVIYYLYESWWFQSFAVCSPLREMIQFDDVQRGWSWRQQIVVMFITRILS